MKKEIIEALCKAIAPTTPTDPRERSRLARLLLEFGKKDRPSINAAELARLVDVRLRQRKDRAGITPEKIVEEIEATLDLVEMCEFMLEARRRPPKQTQSEMFDTFNETALTNQAKQIKAAIEGESYPLDFHKGLMRMRVPGDSAKERESAFWEYFKSAFANGNVRYSEDEMRKSYEEQTQVKWRGVVDLWNTAKQWMRWWSSEKSQKNSAAGKASGRVRKPGSKPKK